MLRLAEVKMQISRVSPIFLYQINRKSWGHRGGDQDTSSTDIGVAHAQRCAGITPDCQGCPADVVSGRLCY